MRATCALVAETDALNQTSAYEYDENGQITKFTDADGKGTTFGRVTTLSYDAADRPTEGIDDNATAGTATDDQRITTGFDPISRLIERVVQSKTSGSWQTDQTVTRTYFANGLQRTLETRNGLGAVVETHTLSYEQNGDYVNGNRTQDTFKLVGPDPSAPCDAVACTATYRYDARERLVHHEDGHNTIADYTLDPAGNVTSEVLSGGQSQTALQTFVGNQLRTRSVNGQMQRYFYDAYGNVDCITNDAGTQGDCSPVAGAPVSTSLVQDFGYDDLNRLSSSRSFTASAETDSASYTYDPLDRPIAETEKHGSDVRSISFRYRGIGNDVASEEQRDGQGGLISTKSYGYDQLGDKASLVVAPQGQSATRSTYGYDPHGSISLLLGSNGTATAAYGYTPYGKTDTALTKGDAGATNPLNPYRYSGKRHDSGSGTLDMGARRYLPDAGRFLQPDLYTDALANLDLAADPLTNNRYLFTGANPVNYIEIDGHWYAETGSGTGPAKEPWIRQQERQQAIDDMNAHCKAANTCNANLKSAKSFVSEASGWADIKQCFTSCDTGILTVIPILKPAKIAKAAKAILTAKRAAKAGTRTVDATLDATGKVHGKLPQPADLGKYDPDDLARLRDQLRQSVQKRIEKTVELGADYGHSARLAEEQALIRSIEKHLRDR